MSNKIDDFKLYLSDMSGKIPTSQYLTAHINKIASNKPPEKIRPILNLSDFLIDKKE